MRHRRIIVSIALLACCLPLSAQQLSDSYYRENPSWVDAELWATDGEYHLMPMSLTSPFESFALYGFSFVSYAHRGEHRTLQTNRLGAITLDSPLQRYPDYSLLSLLRRVPSQREEYDSSTHSEWGADLRGEIYHISPSSLVGHHNLRMQLSSRTYRTALGYRGAWQNEQGVNYSFAAGGRWGRDAVVEGLFTQEEYIWIAGEKSRTYADGLTGRTELALMVSPTVRSMRSWNSEEVFSLSGNRYYNSYWGEQNGKVRSSRLRREFVPALYIAWNLNDSYILSNVNISAMVRAGRKSRSTLDWVDAPSPIPDYHLYLPSYSADPQAALLMEEVWREGDRDYTQIDWHRLYHANTLFEGARYAVMDERHDLFSVDLDGSAALLGAEGGRVGLRVSMHDAREYNVAADMLGSERLLDGYDLYDYSVRHESSELYLSLHGVEEWGSYAASAELGAVAMEYRSRTTQRRGRDIFAVAAARFSWNQTLSEALRVGATAHYNRSAPYWADVYGAPEGSMSRNRWAKGENMLGAELRGEYELGEATLYATLYARMTTTASRVEHFWNDVRDEYTALMVGGMERLDAGAELSLRMPLSPQLRLEGHLAAGSYRFVGNAVADMVLFDTGGVVAEEAHIGLKGAVASSSPRLLGALKLNYYTSSGWMMGLECAAVSQRVLEPSLWLRSSSLPLEKMSSDERERLLEQGSLGNAYNLSAFLFRRFGDFSLSLSLRNLLGSRNSYYDGYQPSRLYITEKEYAQSYKPHSPRVQYIYPLHAYVTLNYDF